MSQCGHIFLDDLNDPLNTPSSSNSFTRPLIKKNNVKTQFGIIDYSRNKTNPLAQIPRLSVQQETLPVFFNMDKTNKKKIEALPKESNSKAKSSTNILNHNIAIEEPKQSQTPMIMNKLLRLNKYSSCSSFIMFNQDNLLPKRLEEILMEQWNSKTDPHSKQSQKFDGKRIFQLTPKIILIFL